jgi:type II secretory pathway pseudopilin PulG
LVELLVVIAIIGILVALLLPAVQAAREAARRSSCSNNLHQIGIALHNYADVYKRLPPAAIWKKGRGTAAPASGEQRNFTWISFILPFMEQRPLHEQIDFRFPLGGPDASYAQVVKDGTNIPISSKLVPTMLCPSDPGFQLGVESSHRIGWSNYAGAEGYDWWFRGGHGLSGVFNLNASVKLQDIKDGTSNTIAVAEASVSGFDPKPGAPGHQHSGDGLPRIHGEGNYVFRCLLLACNTNNDVHSSWGLPNPDGAVAGFWWRGGPFAMQPTYIHCFGINNNWPGAHSLHPGGAQAVLCDASTRFLNENIDYPGEQFTGYHLSSGVWGALNSYNGHETQNLSAE